MPTGNVRALGLGCAIAALLCGIAVAAGVPPETADRLARALEARDRGLVGFIGSYTVTAHAVVEKPGGKDRQESLFVIAVTRRANGIAENRVVKALENGKDITEQEQAKAANATPRPTKTPKASSTGGDGEKRGKGDATSAELRLPTGDDAGLYRFAAPVEEGDLVVVAFEPLAERRKDDGAVKGRLAWRRDTLDPAWLEAELVALPTGMSALVMRFEFARLGDLMYTRLTTTKGAGGILWIKRNFEGRMEISDLTPAAPATPAAGK